jgi:uncharacterized protein (UPF0335 family)
MAATQSVQSLFSNLRRFTWGFTENFHPSMISCIAFSADEARECLLQYVRQIESFHAEKIAVEQQISALFNSDRKSDAEAICSEVQLLRKQLDEKLPLIENNTGYYCKPLLDYSCNMEICHCNGKDMLVMTLQELIETTEPTVREVSLVTVTSCLDG